MGGGPAGFGLASQNDAPMAAKAHVLGTAFLGIEMKCARCHDAPYHETKQMQLFEMAAMLNKATLTLPKTSTVPASTFAGRKPLIVSAITDWTLPPNAPVERGIPKKVAAMAVIL